MTADDCRALARKYNVRARRAQDAQRRKALLEMAAHWNNAAAMLQRTFTLIRQYDECIAAAKSLLDESATEHDRYNAMMNAADLFGAEPLRK